MAGDKQVLSKFRHLFQAAKSFEAKAPKYRRIEQERQALREALMEAGLVLSVLRDDSNPKKVPSKNGDTNKKSKK